MNGIAVCTPVGTISVWEDERGLCGVHLLREGEERPRGEATPLLAEAERRLLAYFAGELREFDLPLSMAAGSAFDRSVWRALLRIPYGEVRTYGQLARELGRPGAGRAVGGACSRNPLLIVVPCHRVVAGTGRLTGFAAGLQTKRALLELEGRRIEGDRIALP
ncbi:MAG: methylated-DNA--[protein]-cysteine S-methyltransferase [Clostridia bacterium]|nr:methylated-DNA--[protein]-cysteine S-methyltransferase [Clostridia bacterium]